MARMVEYVYYVRQSRPEVHPHSPNGVIVLGTEDINVAASFIAGDVLQYDIGDSGDELIVRKVESKAKFVIDDELVAKSRGMDIKYER